MTDAKAGEFSEQIQLHKGIILRICRIYRKDKDDQADLYQETVLNAWHAYPRFERRSKFSTWLYRVALNTALHQNRKNKFARQMTDLATVENKASDDQDQDDLKMLEHAISLLDELEKSIILLYLEEISYKEISEITGLTETNVGVRLNRIKIKLKQTFESYGAR
jgi:RNA polymerase sigma factor (sigma-70 family)